APHLSLFPFVALLIVVRASLPLLSRFSFFYTVPPSTELYPLSLHDALPISAKARMNLIRRRSDRRLCARTCRVMDCPGNSITRRSEEHTSELQSHLNLVCRLLLEKKKKKKETKNEINTEPKTIIKRTTRITH